MFDLRDDARDREGREDGRERVYDEREQGDHDPREGLMRDLDLPRGEERDLVVDRDRVYELDGQDSRTLAAVLRRTVSADRPLIASETGRSRLPATRVRALRDLPAPPHRADRNDLVSPLGIEPRTNRLRVCCSAS